MVKSILYIALFMIGLEISYAVHTHFEMVRAVTSHDISVAQDEYLHAEEEKFHRDVDALLVSRGRAPIYRRTDGGVR